MKLTKRIKLRHQLGRPAARWLPTGYYKNRAHHIGRVAAVGQLDNLAMCVTPGHMKWRQYADVYAGRWVL